MNDYSLIIMRTRDQAKQEAIVQASIKLVNELGFDGISISKIATEADVSPATIYIYYKNKEDLFTEIYKDIRKQMSQGTLQDLQENMTVEEEFKLLCSNTFHSYLEHPEFIFYRERYQQTAMFQSLNKEQFELFQFSTELLKRGIKGKVIKDLPIPLLASFAFFPIITLLRFHFDGIQTMDDHAIKEACELAWNSIRR